MPNDPTTNGPWRVLILDRDPADPKWIVATVTTPADVQPAVTSPGGEFTTLAGETGQWLRGLLGHPVRLTPLHRPEVWSIDPAVPGVGDLGQRSFQ